MIEKISNFFNTQGAVFGCISAYIVGSYANMTYDDLSDLDLVIIGEDANTYKEIKSLGLAIRRYLIEKLNRDCIFYCEPSQELLCLLNIENLKKLRVHIIYHPQKRFEKYIQEGDQVLISWSLNYNRIYGKEFFSSEILYRNSPKNEMLFSNTVNLIVQNLHNSYLLADISSNHIYYLKLYKFMLKRLREIESTPSYLSVSSNHNFSINNEFNHFQKLLNDNQPINLKERILALEKFLFDLEKRINC
jgi:predicted nucleotidyltransferase